jgi:hypothetical protein
MERILLGADEMNRCFAVVALLCAMPAYAAEPNQLSEQSQRDQQFYRCQLEAMKRHQDVGAYIMTCMGAAGWRERGRSLKEKEADPTLMSCERYLYPTDPFCFERMK